jgi:hypothetical protein
VEVEAEEKRRILYLLSQNTKVLKIGSSESMTQRTMVNMTLMTLL